MSTLEDQFHIYVHCEIVRWMSHVDHLRKIEFEVMATDHEVAVPELIDDCVPIHPPAQTTTTAQPSSIVLYPHCINQLELELLQTG